MNLSKMSCRDARFLDMPRVTYIGFGFENWHIGIFDIGSGIWRSKMSDWLSVTNPLLYEKKAVQTWQRILKYIYRWKKCPPIF